MLLHNSGVSVIVCCYNSSLRLPETLKHLAKQEMSNIPWEIILVNNASTDNTSEVARTESNKYNQLTGKFSIVYEEQPGLSYARQKGAMVAQYNYIIFCDDDNWLDQNYLTNAYYIMEGDKQIGALGGKGTAVTDDIQFPGWFKSLQSGFAVGPQSPFQGDVSKTCLLWGAGMVTRTELFLKCFNYIFPPILTDRKKDALSSGGDTEFCMRLLLKGYKLYYDERLTFTHFISKKRWSTEYFERLEIARRNGIYDASELKKYTLLIKLINANYILQPLIIVKTLLGYLSTIFLKRKSWSFSDIKIIFYYYTKIDLGVDYNTKLIYEFYCGKTYS